MNEPFRPKFTTSILQWVFLDLLGMAVLAVGGFYLLKDQTFITGFPSSTLEAIAVVVVGIGMIFASAVKMLAEIMAQKPGAGQNSPPGKQ